MSVLIVCFRIFLAAVGDLKVELYLLCDFRTLSFVEVCLYLCLVDWNAPTCTVPTCTVPTCTVPTCTVPTCTVPIPVQYHHPCLIAFTTSSLTIPPPHTHTHTHTHRCTSREAGRISSECPAPSECRAHCSTVQWGGSRSR